MVEARFSGRGCSVGVGGGHLFSTRSLARSQVQVSGIGSVFARQEDLCGGSCAGGAMPVTDCISRTPRMIPLAFALGFHKAEASDTWDSDVLP